MELSLQTVMIEPVELHVEQGRTLEHYGRNKSRQGPQSPDHTTSKAVPPARASSVITSSRPMTLKNAFGSMPCADVQSVPVFFNDLIAARIPWTAATQDTREKTVDHGRSNSWFAAAIEHSDKLTDNLGTVILSFLTGEGWCETTRDDVDEDGLGSECGDSVFQKIRGLHALNEADISARVCSELETKNGLLHAKHLRGVGSANNDLFMNKDWHRSQE